MAIGHDRIGRKSKAHKKTEPMRAPFFLFANRQIGLPSVQIAFA